MARPPRPGAHDALLEAARDEFASRGLENARVEDVARRARLSKGAFYLHFRTKDDAFREILQRFLGAMEEQAARRHDAEQRFRENAGGWPPELAERLDFECSCDVEMLELMWRNRKLIAVIDGAGGHRFSRTIRDFRERMRAIVSRNLAHSQASGHLRQEVDPAVAGDVVVGTYEAFVRRMAEMKQKPDLAAWARAFLLLLYGGMAASAEQYPGPRRTGSARR